MPGGDYGTNTGDVTLGAFGSSPNANAASLSGQILTLQPASVLFPGGVSTGAQEFAGVKTFTNPVLITPAIGVATGTSLTLTSYLSSLYIAPSYQAIATAAGTTTLTNASPGKTEFTGVTTQTCVLMDVSTLPKVGSEFLIINSSTGIVTVQSSGLNTIQAMDPGTRLFLSCASLSGTGIASWTYSYLPRQQASSTMPGWLTVGAQSISGLKSFLSTLSSPNYSGNVTRTVGSGQTITMDSTSTQYQTGVSGTITFNLPDVTTIPLGTSYFFYCASGTNTINSSGGNLIGTALVSTMFLSVQSKAVTGTTAAAWELVFLGSPFSNGLSIALRNSSGHLVAGAFNSSTSNISTVGSLRLASSDTIFGIRNNANSADITLTKSSSDIFTLGSSLAVTGDFTASGLSKGVNVIPGISVVAGTGQTITLTVGSPQTHVHTPGGNITYTLPVASTLDLGTPYNFFNNSGSNVTTINTSGGNTLATLVTGNYCTVISVLTSGTGTGSWTANYSSSNAVANTVVRRDTGGAIAGGYYATFGTLATTGALRLQSTEGVYWRNNANSGNLALVKDTSDIFSIQGQFKPYFGGVATAGGLAVSTYVNTTQTGNGAGATTDAFSHSVVAATLSTNGDALEFYAAGTFAATASTDKRVQVIFGGTTIFNTGDLNIIAANSWSLRGQIIRTGAATQKCVVTFTNSSAVLTSTTTYSTAAETLSGAITMKLTVGGTNANDTVAEFYKEKWMAA